MDELHLYPEILMLHQTEIHITCNPINIENVWRMGIVIDIRCTKPKYVCSNFQFLQDLLEKGLSIVLKILSNTNFLGTVIKS